MLYAYWKSGHHEDDSVFELFFRRNPFKGEFTVFAGLEDCLRYIANFKFDAASCRKLADKFPSWDPTFWDYLQTLDCSKVRIYAPREGTLVFPREPLLRVEGPLGICQVLETTLLVLINFASLIATNAARHRLAVGPDKALLEFGLRRAQGPDGAMTASRYAVLGGFDGTSNVKAGIEYGLALSGTHAHSFVGAYQTFADLKTTILVPADGGEPREFLACVLANRKKLKAMGTNDGELAAFTAYAQSFPTAFLALIDTYDVLESGLPNFLAVALALHEFGYMARGIRLDSGDLAYLSKRCRNVFEEVATAFGVEAFRNLTIVASNDLSEEVLWSLKEQGHSIDAFGVGTNLVTCSAQPALGCVYKLVEVRGEPRMKISQDHFKVTIPGRKECYRLYNSQGQPVVDIMVPTYPSAPDSSSSEPPASATAATAETSSTSSPVSRTVTAQTIVGKTPRVGERVLCRHPFDPTKRVFVTPSKVEKLHHLVWDCGKIVVTFPTIQESREYVLQQLATFRSDHLRHLNPTPYKVALSAELFTFMHDLWSNVTPIIEIF